MKWLRLLGIILSLTLEVRVRAAEQDPGACLKNNIDKCAIFTNRPTTINSPNLTMKLRAGSILFRDRKREWNFVDGTMRVQTATDIKFKTRVGTLNLSQGAFWVQWKDEKIWVYAMEGEAQLELTSPELGKQIVPEGFVNWFGLIGSENKNLRGIPKIITLDFIKQKIGHLSPSEIKSISNKESRSLVMASDFYRELVQTMEDQNRSAVEAAEKREARKIRRNKEIRDLFRAKYLSPVDFDNVE